MAKIEPNKVDEEKVERVNLTDTAWNAVLKTMTPETLLQLVSQFKTEHKTQGKDFFKNLKWDELILPEVKKKLLDPEDGPRFKAAARLALADLREDGFVKRLEGISRVCENAKLHEWPIKKEIIKLAGDSLVHFIKSVEMSNQSLPFDNPEFSNCFMHLRQFFLEFEKISTLEDLCDISKTLRTLFRSPLVCKITEEEIELLKPALIDGAKLLGNKDFEIFIIDSFVKNFGVPPTFEFVSEVCDIAAQEILTGRKDRKDLAEAYETIFSGSLDQALELIRAYRVFIRKNLIKEEDINPEKLKKARCVIIDSFDSTSPESMVELVKEMDELLPEWGLEELKILFKKFLDPEFVGPKFDLMRKEFTLGFEKLKDEELQQLEDTLMELRATIPVAEEFNSSRKWTDQALQVVQQGIGANILL